MENNFTFSKDEFEKYSKFEDAVIEKGKDILYMYETLYRKVGNSTDKIPIKMRDIESFEYSNNTNEVFLSHFLYFHSDDKVEVSFPVRFFSMPLESLEEEMEKFVTEEIRIATIEFEERKKRRDEESYQRELQTYEYLKKKFENDENKITFEAREFVK